MNRITGLISLTFSLLTVVFFSGCIESEEVYDDQDRYNDELKAIDAYLAENNIQAQKDLATGIRYVVHEAGSGLRPFVVDSVTVNITGKVLADGHVFESEVDIKKRWSRLISGAIIGLNKIQEGGSITAYVPSYYGYGKEGAEGVPANAPLVLELSLHEVHSTRLMRDIAAIQDSLNAWNISASIDPSGIRYVLHDPGTGKFPTIANTLTVNYAGRVLGATDNFDSGDNVTFKLNDLVSGWKIILPLVREGGSVTMYVPSVLAYGASGAGSIPPNSNLIFDVDLIKVE